VGSEYGEIICRINVGWLCRHICFKIIFDLLNEIKLFVQNKGSSIEKINDEDG
jgi:hypothetical protein